MKKFLFLISLLFVLLFTGCADECDCDDGCPTDNAAGNDQSGSDDSDPGTTPAGSFKAHFHTSWSSAYIHFDDGAGWTTPPGNAMTSEGNGWFVYTHNNWTGSVKAVFNDGGELWDNNNDENYISTVNEFWVKDGEVYAYNPGGENPGNDVREVVDPVTTPDEDVVDPCADVTCEEWETCVSGSCTVSDGRCATTEDCGSGEKCDVATHNCVEATDDPPVIVLKGQPIVTSDSYSFDVEYSGGLDFDIEISCGYGER